MVGRRLEIQLKNVGSRGSNVRDYHRMMSEENSFVPDVYAGWWG